VTDPSAHFPPTVETVRRYIVRKGLQPGDRFPADVALAVELGVGMSRLRHAMRTLHQLGVVQRRRKAGTVLIHPDPSHLAAHIRFHVDLGTYTPEEIRRARAMLEHGIAAEAARNRTSRDLLEMTVAIEAMEAAEGDYKTVNGADRDFHEAVLAAGKNPFASLFSRVIVEGFERLPAMLRVSKGEPFRRILSDHKEIFASISKQESQQAGELMYQHIAYPQTTVDECRGSDQPIRRNKKSRTWEPFGYR